MKIRKRSTVERSSRQGKPNATYTCTDPSDGSIIRLSASATGLIELSDDRQQRAADVFGLPRANEKKPSASRSETPPAVPAIDDPEE